MLTLRRGAENFPATHPLKYPPPCAFVLCFHLWLSCSGLQDQDKDTGKLNFPGFRVPPSPNIKDAKDAKRASLQGQPPPGEDAGADAHIWKANGPILLPCSPEKPSTQQLRARAHDH